MAKLSENIREELRLFAFYLANGTVDVNLLDVDGTGDYSSIFEMGSPLEQVFAIWSNVLEIDDKGEVVNAGEAKKRAAQYIRRYIDSDYIVEPPFEAWEVELH